MVPERKTKPCTFPGCEGRMVLTHEESDPDPALGQLVGGPLRRGSFWTCEIDQTHRVEASSEDSA